MVKFVYIRFVEVSVLLYNVDMNVYGKWGRHDDEDDDVGQD